MKTTVLFFALICSFTTYAQREKIDAIQIDSDMIIVYVSGKNKTLELRNKVIKNIHESEKYYRIGEEKLRHSIDYYAFDDGNGSMYNIKEWVTSFDIVYTIENND